MNHPQTYQGVIFMLDGCKICSNTITPSIARLIIHSPLTSYLIRNQVHLDLESKIIRMKTMFTTLKFHWQVH